MDAPHKKVKLLQLWLHDLGDQHSPDAEQMLRQALKRIITVMLQLLQLRGREPSDDKTEREAHASYVSATFPFKPLDLACLIRFVPLLALPSTTVSSTAVLSSRMSDMASNPDQIFQSLTQLNASSFKSDQARITAVKCLKSVMAGLMTPIEHIFELMWIQVSYSAVFENSIYQSANSLRISLP